MENIDIKLCSDKDIDILAVLNKQLIEDEKHDNKMEVDQLKDRMRTFINTDYKAFFFTADTSIVGYALVNMKQDPLYLRQFFICREERKKGYGTVAFNKLLEELDSKTIDIEVMVWNYIGMSFWKLLGFEERSTYMTFGKYFET